MVRLTPEFQGQSFKANSSRTVRPVDFSKLILLELNEQALGPEVRQGARGQKCGMGTRGSVCLSRLPTELNTSVTSLYMTEDVLVPTIAAGW